MVSLEILSLTDESDWRLLVCEIDEQADLHSPLPSSNLGAP